MRRPPPRRSSKLRRGAALLAATAVAAGCAAFRGEPPKPAQVPAEVLAPPAPTPPPAPAPLPPLPPASVGPRAPEPEPPKVQAPAPPPALPTAPPVPPAQRGRFVVLNFDNADVETVIQAASEIVGFNYVLAPDVRGKVTVQTSGRIPQEDVFGVLLAILEVHGFTAVKAGTLYKIVRIEGARERAVPTIVGAQPDPGRVTDEIVTQIVPLRFSSVTDLSALLRPLISQRGSLIAHRETNVLIITDTASNIRRLLDIVRQVDVEVAREELQILPIQYADAADLASILNQLFASGRVRTAAPGAVPAPTPVPAPVPVPGAPAAAPRPAAPEVSGALERPPLIIAERRSNSLIVHAKKHEIETIRRLVGQLDINIYGGRRVFIYYAENAKSKDLAGVLNQIYGREGAPPTPTTPIRGGPTAPTPPPPPVIPATPLPPGITTGGDGSIPEGVRFIADEVTNAVIVTTYPRAWTEIEQTIKQLDRMPRQVLIEVLVTEITLTDDTRLGIDWALREGSFRLSQQSISATSSTIVSPDLRVPPTTALTLPAGGLTAFAFQADKFFAMLNALASENRVNVLSSPHVLTSENKKAVINVSDSIPIVTSQQTGTLNTPATTAGTTSTTQTTGSLNQTVEYRDAGVILTVTPRIGERGTVALDVKQEVNDIGDPEPPTNSRRIIKREAETSVVLMNNQTLVLAGLIRDRQEQTDRGIPFLSRIPVLGLLFGAKSWTTRKTELLLLITPRVIGTPLDAARLTDQYRRGTPGLEEAVKRAPRPPTPFVPPSPSGPPPSSP